MRKLKKNDGYCIIVESANPHKLATASMPKDEFDALCRKSQNVTLDYCIIKDKENENGLE